jgi:CDP-diacylglycerol--serine O-phosphatidyltransferase
MNIKSLVPNSLTLGNLTCGVLAIDYITQAQWEIAAGLVLLAAVFDFFDGFAARLLKVGSALGGQLDSLADMVTFGVVPGFFIWKWLDFINTTNMEWLPYIGLIIPAMSCYRLAKFNIDERQTTSFIGLPTPANALVMLSIPLIGLGTWNDMGFGASLINFPLSELCNNVVFISIITVVFSYLLIAELPLFALKFKSFGWAGNQVRWTFLLLAILLIALFAFMAIPIIILLYLLISIINNILHKQHEV